SLRCSSSTARRDSTTLLRERLSSITLHSIVWLMYSSRFGTRRMSTNEAGRKPRTPRSMIRPPLTTSITAPSTGSPDSAAASIRRQAFSKRARLFLQIKRPSRSSFVRTSRALDPPPGLLEAGALLAQDQASVLILLGQHERVYLFAQVHLIGGVNRLADRELAGGDDALG